jgi:hypothetical protein
MINKLTPNLWHFSGSQINIDSFFFQTSRDLKSKLFHDDRFCLSTSKHFQHYHISRKYKVDLVVGVRELRSGVVKRLRVPSPTHNITLNIYEHLLSRKTISL